MNYNRKTEHRIHPSTLEVDEFCGGLLKAAFSKFFRNKYWFAAVLILGFILLCAFLFPEVFAYSNVQGVKDNYDNFIEGAQQSSVRYMGDAYSSFSAIFDPSNSETLGFKGIYLVQTTIAILAGGAIAIFFTVNIIKEAQKGDLSTEYWQRVILNLVISLVVTLLATRIMSAIYELGNGVIQNFIKGFGEGVRITELEDKKEDFAKLLSKIPGLESLADIVGSSTNQVDYRKLSEVSSMLVFMEYVVWFPMVICVFLMYSAIFEIKIRELFAPLAVTSIMVEGSRGSGARFLKKYAACFLKIAIYFAIAYLGMALTKYFFTKAIGDVNQTEMSLNMIYMLMSNVVAGMAMMQTGGLADEILGV